MAMGPVRFPGLASVDTFVFDKTGTLTQGKLQLGDVEPLSTINEYELIRTAALAERRSEHLLARLIVREAESRGAVVPFVDSFAAQHVECLPGVGFQQVDSQDHT